MSEEKYNAQIETVASLTVKDGISLDEQEPKKLKKYYDFVKREFKMDGDHAVQLVNEAFLLLKLKNSKDLDPLQEGDRFGAGFS